jgi:uncharacterized protein YkwD
MACADTDIATADPYEIANMEALQHNKWIMAEEILIKINKYRSDQSLGKIEFNKNSATALAVEHCIYMIENGKVSHENFSKRNQALIEIGAVKVGENIAFGYTLSSSIVNAWINSPGHKKVLEGNYNHIGIGVVTSANNKNYVTALFYLK